MSDAENPPYAHDGWEKYELVDGTFVKRVGPFTAKAFSDGSGAIHVGRSEKPVFQFDVTKMPAVGWSTYPTKYKLDARLTRLLEGEYAHSWQLRGGGDGYQLEVFGTGVRALVRELDRRNGKLYYCFHIYDCSHSVDNGYWFSSMDAAKVAAMKRLIEKGWLKPSSLKPKDKKEPSDGWVRDNNLPNSKLCKVVGSFSARVFRDGSGLIYFTDAGKKPLVAYKHPANQNDESLTKAFFDTKMRQFSELLEKYGVRWELCSEDYYSLVPVTAPEQRSWSASVTAHGDKSWTYVVSNGPTSTVSPSKYVSLEYTQKMVIIELLARGLLKPLHKEPAVGQPPPAPTFENMENARSVFAGLWEAFKMTPQFVPAAVKDAVEYGVKKGLNREALYGMFLNREGAAGGLESVAGNGLRHRIDSLLQELAMKDPVADACTPMRFYYEKALAKVGKPLGRPVKQKDAWYKTDRVKLKWPGDEE